MDSLIDLFGRAQQALFEGLVQPLLFTAGLGNDSHCERIVEALTGLGRGLGVDVIVEGVETEQQAAMLRTAGCDEYQGFLFARPMPAADLAAWLERQPLPLSGPRAVAI